MSTLITVINSFLVFQLCIPTKLYPTWPMGDWLRHVRRQHPTDHPTKQEPLSGATRRVQRGIVSVDYTYYHCRVFFVWITRPRLFSDDFFIQIFQDLS